MSYHFHIEELDSKNKRITYNHASTIMTIKDFIKSLSVSQFINVLVASFTRCGFTFYMIKSSRISEKTLNTSFSITITETFFPSTKANYTSFATYLARDKKHFQVFTSISGNTLIIPSPKYGGEVSSENWKNYHNITGFLQHAPKPKIYTFWKVVKSIVLNNLRQGQSITLRTIGHHIPYFHFRIEL